MINVGHGVPVVDGGRGLALVEVAHVVDPLVNLFSHVVALLDLLHPGLWTLRFQCRLEMIIFLRTYQLGLYKCFGLYAIWCMANWILDVYQYIE